ncbi:MAG TPA: SDR family oxidoreductase [Burkholderiales bacterium]|jgi:NAD(P)-dependent dehydrogenase (short-subunit alcohol dehydrogenase family)|nr:SDR family oxidoreductase [Burkholderiales bacterium]
MKDKQVVIVGGTGSIGSALVRQLSAQGARVRVTGRDSDSLASAEKGASGVQSFLCEVTSEASVGEVFSHFDDIDHVVVLAGSSGGGPFMETPASRQRYVLEERVWGAIYAVRAAVPKMRGGSITLTSGLFASRPPAAGSVMLVTALSAVEGLVRGLARELAPIRINAVSFGVVRSTRHRHMGADQEPYYRRLGNALPTGRVGEPDHAAHAIVFAMQNDYLTGEVLHVDGGARLV